VTGHWNPGLCLTPSVYFPAATSKNVKRPFLSAFVSNVCPSAPRSSRRGFERALSLGVSGRYSAIPGAVHGVALRMRRGRLVPLPRAARWAELVEGELRRFAGS